MTRQIEEADQQIAAATVLSPTGPQVQEAWNQVLRVWEVLTEEERADLLGSVVQVVKMTEKESVTLELIPTPHSLTDYSHRFELKSQMGAGRLAVVNYPPIQFPDFEVSRISRRAWKPGEAAQAQE